MRIREVKFPKQNPKELVIKCKIYKLYYGIIKRVCSSKNTLKKGKGKAFAKQMAKEGLTSKLKIKTKSKKQTSLDLVDLCCHNKISYNKITTGICFLIALDVRKSPVQFWQDLISYPVYF